MLGKPLASSTREIPLSTLRDKIAGGWAGQMIGVSFGAPTEFRSREAILPEDKLPKWAPGKVDNSLTQDDLYVDMTFAKVLDDKGLDATTEDFGAMFREAQYKLWHANLAARRALKRGVPAKLSGTPKYNVHANDIDFQIEADFIGMMTPGMSRSANAIAARAGRVMNYGDGIYGGMFIAGMYAAAFFESDPRQVVEAGLASIPAASPYARLIRDVLDLSKQYPEDWIKVWNLLEQKWDKREPCPEGAMRPFNIDAKLNGGYVALGVLYGQGEIGKTITISTRCGQDSDCNPSSAAGIVGVMSGYQAIPDEWKGGIAAIADRKFDYTDFTFHSIVESTYQRALSMTRRNGGKVEGDRLIVKLQTPKAPKLEIWDDYGSPVERIGTADSRWHWSGEWKTEEIEWGGTVPVRSASEKGAAAEIEFQGTGAILTGFYLPTGGKADVFLDEKLDRTVDVYPDENSRKGGEAVWHGFGLKAGKHSLRLVVRGETYPGSTGTDITLTDLVVFRP